MSKFIEVSRFNSNEKILININDISIVSLSETESQIATIVFRDSNSIRVLDTYEEIKAKLDVIK